MQPRMTVPVAKPGEGLRLSVSALRDYRRCPRYYKHKRIDKTPERMTHHAPVGNLEHNAFYMAYGYPYQEYDPDSDRTKLKWEVSGDFRPDDALQAFDKLFWRPADPVAREEYDLLDGVSEELHLALTLLDEDTPVADNFVTGPKKALKVKGQNELKHGWYHHYREMLVDSLRKPLKYPVLEIERESHFYLGGILMKGYADLVLDASADMGPGKEIGVDLKSGYTKPSKEEVYFDDQVQSYYVGFDFAEFWLFHMRSGEIFGIPRDERLIQSLDEMAEQDAMSIQHGFFPKRYDKRECIRCPFRQECHGV